jgi:hypothetical protein
MKIMPLSPNLSHSWPTGLSRNMGRRNFLCLGSAFSASLLLPIGLKASRLLPINPAEDRPTSGLADSLLSIGFLSADHDIAGSRNAASMIAANHLQAGDPTFLQRGAQVTIQGINHPMNLQSMAAYVHYLPAELPDEVKVCAWCATYKPFPTVTATNRLSVPVQAAEGLKLSFDWHDQATEMPMTSLLAQLTVGNEPHLPKLQRGTYLITGPRDRANPLPVWPDYQMQAVESDSFADRLTLSRHDRAPKTSLPADFPYLQISIDYGPVTA